MTLLFSQAASDPAWTTAIKVRAAHTTLDGFAVRFAGPIRWADGVELRPGRDRLDRQPRPRPGAVNVGLSLTHLDLQSPPCPTAPRRWRPPSLIRLATAFDGTIAGNTLKGGTTEFLGGPWTITTTPTSAPCPTPSR